MNGPKIELQLSCYKCQWCLNESYNFQSDSGIIVYCNADNKKKRIGDTVWETPDWCPKMPEILQEIKEKINQYQNI